MSKYNDVKVSKAKGKKADEVSTSAFQMMKGAYALGGLFPHVVTKQEDKPDVMDSCNLLVNLWTNQKVATVNEGESEKALHGSNIDDAFIPNMSADSKIIDKEMRKRIILALPGRCQGYPWIAAFCTEQHGFSLAELYRRMVGHESMVLLLIETLTGTKFGALMSEKPAIKDGYYGKGESFLFTFLNGEFVTYRWTGESDLFFRGTDKQLQIGAGDGHFGISLDEDLNRGRTEKCLTFGNDPLAETKDFTIKKLECWAFEIPDDE